MTEKPLHVRVWEALNGLDMDTTGAWATVWGLDNEEQFPRYDTDWSATGPLIERFGFWIWTQKDLLS